MLYDDWRLGSISGAGGAFGHSFADRGAGTDDLLHLVVSSTFKLAQPASHARVDSDHRFLTERY
jgi:hypothetical protein